MSLVERHEPAASRRDLPLDGTKQPDQTDPLTDGRDPDVRPRPCGRRCQTIGPPTGLRDYLQDDPRGKLPRPTAPGQQLRPDLPRPPLLATTDTGGIDRPQFHLDPYKVPSTAKADTRRRIGYADESFNPPSLVNLRFHT